MRRVERVLILACLLVTVSILGMSPMISAKKIKNSFRIEKDSKKKAKPAEELPGREITLADSLSLKGDPEVTTLLTQLLECGFAGYDKEPNSNNESFILINKSERPIIGYKVRIDYMDMKGRMLHSRTIEEACLVPPGETRRFDIKSWDTQRTYYYYLGNAPKRVATPFQVKFTPISFRI